jgi:biopolymer transport protein TolR
MATSPRSGRTRKFKSEINVVPYIDVMLVLLVIFMVVAPLTTPGVLNLPSAERTAQPPTEYVEIGMRRDAEGSYEYTIGLKQSRRGKTKMQRVDRASLMEKLREMRKKNKDYPVLIAAEDKSEYGDVVKLISDVKKIGVQRVGLATK